MAIGELGAADLNSRKLVRALLKSISKNTFRKGEHSLTNTCFWSTKRPCVSPWSTNILFWKVYFKRGLCWRALFYPSVHLKTCLVFARVPYFRAEDNEPLAQRRHPRHFFYLDRIHPVFYHSAPPRISESPGPHTSRTASRVLPTTPFFVPVPLLFSPRLKINHFLSSEAGWAQHTPEPRADPNALTWCILGFCVICVY